MGITHKWNGTVLTVTSDSGTSSADLKGAQGDSGPRGAQGPSGSNDVTDWIDATLENDFIEYAELYNPKYRRAGQVVTICGAVKTTNAANEMDGTEPVTVFTLPEGFRPKRDLIILSQGSSTNIFCLQITCHTGTVGICRYRNGTTLTKPTESTWLPISATFIIA